MAWENVCCSKIPRRSKAVTCGTKSTCYSAAVASPATARLACECGLPITTNDDLQVIAGLHADIQTLSALLEEGMPLTDTVVNTVVSTGCLEVLQQLLSIEHCPKPGQLSYYAARSGSITMRKWLKEQGFKMGHRTYEGAASRGNLAALLYLHTAGCDEPKQYIACDAVEGGSIEVVEWLRQEYGIKFDAETLAWAAGRGQLVMCKHLRSIGCKMSTDACRQAATHSAIDMLHWLRQNGVNGMFQKFAFMQLSRASRAS
jgi:hypothetical protein